MCVVGHCLTVEAFKFKHDIWTETPKISWTLQRKTKRLMLQIWTQRKSHILFLKSKACSHLGSLRVAESASLNALEVRVRDGMARWWANIGKKVMNSSDIRGKDIWCGKKKSMIFYSASSEGQMKWDLMQSDLIFLSLFEQVHTKRYFSPSDNR